MKLFLLYSQVYIRTFQIAPHIVKFLDPLSLSPSLSPRISSLAPLLVKFHPPPFPLPSPSSPFPPFFLHLHPRFSAPVSPEGVAGSGAISRRNSSLVRPRIIARANGSFFPASPPSYHPLPPEVRLGKKTSLPAQEFKREAPASGEGEEARRSGNDILFVTAPPSFRIGPSYFCLRPRNSKTDAAILGFRMPAPRFPLIGPRDALVAPLAWNELT